MPASWLRTLAARLTGTPTRRPVRNRPARRLRLEALEDRTVPAYTIQEFPLPTPGAPSGITAGPDGNLWFTDRGNRIGRMTPAGNVTMFSAGISPNSALSGIATGWDGNLWFTERAGRIGRITPDGVVTEFSAGLSPFSHPMFITASRFGDGSLWFTEYGGNRIGRIDPYGEITEYSAGLSPDCRPYDITAGPDGNIWFTEDIDNGRIGRITPDGTITEFDIGNSFNGVPQGITAGPDGNLWFTLYGDSAIGRITPAGVVTRFSMGALNYASQDITTGPDGNLWITSQSGHDIVRITPTGAVTEFSAGITPNCLPWGITTGPDGNIWFTEEITVGDTGNRIGKVVIENPPYLSHEFPVPNNPDQQISAPKDITRGPDGNLWFTDGNRIGRITPAGVLTMFSSGISSYPQDIALGPDGNLWFTEPVTGRIGRITPAGVVTEFDERPIGQQASVISGGAITAGPDGNLWFTGIGYVGRITPAGAVTRFGVPGTSYVDGITAGPDGNLWFADYGSSRIGRITPAGVLTMFTAGVHGPSGIIAGPDGNLWFTEPLVNRIGRITPAGVVTEFRAGGSPVAGPLRITRGPDGNLWFTSLGNHIGRVTPAGVVTMFSLGMSPNGGITTGPDGNLWVTEGNRIGQVVVPFSPLASFALHDSSGNEVPEVNEGAAFRLVGSATANPPWIDNPANLTYRWDFGGGVTRTGRHLDWSFPDNGTYPVTLTVTGFVSGATASYTRSITVNNVPPTVSLLQGAIDGGFGNQGVATTNTADGAARPTQLADGRIVTAFADGTGFRRFLANGSPDPSFDQDGRLDGLTAFVAYTLQGDRIITASRSGSSVSLARYNADGSLDMGFDGDVSAVIPGAVVLTVAGDKILLAGGTDTGMALVRWTANGVLDPSFDEDGVALTTTPIGRSTGILCNTPAALVVQGDNIVVGDYYFAVLRFNGNGALDTTFGTYVSGNSGPRTGCADQVFFATVDDIGNDPLSALALVPGGGILAAGNFGIARYTANGQMDGGFGRYGVVEFNGVLSSTFGSGCGGLAGDSHGDWYGSELGLGLAAGLPFPAGVAVQSDGRILVAGPNGKVGRLNGNGTPDATFGAGPSGIISSATVDGAVGMLLQSGGRVTLVSNTADAIRLLRFTTTLSPDHVVAGQPYTLGLRATDPGAADQAHGFSYEVDWGDGTWVPAGDGAGISPTHVYAAVGAPTGYAIHVRATDKDNGTSDTFSFAVTVMPNSPASVPALLAGNLPTDPVSGLPAVTFAVTSADDATSFISAVLDQPADVALVLNAPGVVFDHDHPPPSVYPQNLTVVINGAVFHGGSPALILNAGNLIVTGSTFVNTTDAPTILVNGGRLTLRNNVIQESTVYSQAAIRVTDGFVDLGTAADPGGNIVNVNGAGNFFLNTTATPITVVDVAFTVNGTPLPPAAASSVQGLVWVDADNNGDVDFGEAAVAGVRVTLTGTDDLGNAVRRVAVTDANGVYYVGDLRPSNAAGYTIAETQPAGMLDGRDTVGTVNGLPAGVASANDVFAGVGLQAGAVAENYNFGERPAAGGGSRQTAAIGFWQNKKGQELIRSLNGGWWATDLGNWLATTFPNLYGSLAGATNEAVATCYRTLFARTAKTVPDGLPKVDVQVMATALAVYVTNSSLAGTTAAAYGFTVTATGVGTRTYNVGDKGAAFGAANGAFVSVLDLLLAVNARSHNGLLYDLNGDGVITAAEAGYRTMANDLFSAINDAGGI